MRIGRVRRIRHYSRNISAINVVKNVWKNERTMPREKKKMCRRQKKKCASRVVTTIHDATRMPTRALVRTTRLKMRSCREEQSRITELARCGSSQLEIYRIATPNIPNDNSDYTESQPSRNTCILTDATRTASTTSGENITRMNVFLVEKNVKCCTAVSLEGACLRISSDR